MVRGFLGIGQRIAAGYVILLALLLAGGLLNLSFYRASVDTLEEIYEHPFTVSNNLLDLRADLLRIDAALALALAYPEVAKDPQWLKDITRQEQDGDGCLDVISARYRGPRSDVQALRIGWSDWRGVVNPMATALSRGETAYARTLYDSVVHAQFLKVQAAQDTLLTFARNRAQSLTHNSMKSFGQRQSVMLLVLIVSLGAGGLLIAWVGRSILRPLAQLRQELHGVSEGLPVPLSHALRNRHDQIGEMAREMENLRQSVASRRLVELKYRTLFRNCPDIVLVSQRESARFIEVNEAFTRVLGYHPNEVLGLSALDVHFWHNPADRQRVMQLLTETRFVAGLEVLLRRKDGTAVTALLSVEQVDLEGQDCVLMVARDISDRKQDEENLRRMVKELAQSNADLARFAQIAVHDLQEPSRSICSYAQLLERTYGHCLDDAGKEYLRFLIAGAMRMREQVGGLKTYAEAGSRSTAFASVDLNQLLAVVETELKPIILEKQAVLMIRHPLPVINGDSPQLQQMLFHILGNALKFQDDSHPPRVTVDVVADTMTDPMGDGAGAGAWWHITVADNGIGIPQEHQEQVFEMFRRLHGPGRYPGAGLGLTLARRIAETHGGRLWLESRPGEGTTVHLTLPAAKME